MSDVIDNTVDETSTATPVVNKELDTLKAKADLLGIQYSGNIGVAKLKEKIDLHMVEIDSTNVAPSKGTTSVGPNKTIMELEADAKRPIRCIINDLDPLYQDESTFIMSVGNRFFKVGPVIIKKDEEQDVPFAILEELRTKTMIKWVQSINHITKRPTGNKSAEQTKRYNINILDMNPDMTI
jgi:hypothetical protein